MSTSVLGHTNQVGDNLGTSLGASGGWVWGFLAGNMYILAVLSSAKIQHQIPVIYQDDILVLALALVFTPLYCTWVLT